jgi:hypothetical protein
MAYTVLADALLAAGAPDDEVATTIAAARGIVSQTGADCFLARLREAEARLAGRHDRDALMDGLREALAMYRAQTAIDPAERLARELAS